jgi:Pol polyprotein/integrase-like protein/gag-pre-integrase-like protein
MSRANNTTCEDTVQEITDEPKFTKEQFNQLLSLINKHHTQGDNKDSTTNSTHFAGNSHLKTQNFDSWILDSGASDHICFDKALLYDLRNLHEKEHYITIPNGKRIKINTIGTVKFANGLILKDVLYAPNFQFNLISVNKLVRDMQCKVWFDVNQCFMQEHSMMKHLLLGRAKNGLYYLRTDDHSHSLDKIKHKSFSASTMYTQSLQQLKVWHLRLGHLPFEKLEVLFPSKKGIHMKDLCFCTICPMAKQTRSNFPRHTIKTVEVFQLLHVDIWGPIKYESRIKCNSFITIVDDYSRYTWIFLIKNKSEFLSIFTQFYEHVFTQFNKKIKCIRSDNAKELASGETLSFFNSKGIISQTTCVNTPQQNGVVERKHRHLLEVARALHFQSKLPNWF